MKIDDSQLPSFGSPPIDEVAIAVQFQGIDHFSLAYGAFYERVRQHLPTYEEHEPIAVQFETFGRSQEAGPEISLESISLRRGWYISADGHELVQLQPNRFVQNWRRLSGVGCYPRFPAIFEQFCENLSILKEVLADLRLEKPLINQADVNYFNNIELLDGEDYPAAFQRVFGWPEVRGLTNELGGFRLEAEACSLNLAIKVYSPDSVTPCARLVATALPAETDSGKKIVRFQLRFRGPPPHIENNGLEEFLLIGRGAIVKSFTDLTSAQCHTIWERER